MDFALTARRREVFGRRTRTLRRANRIPAVLYGHGVTNLPLEIEAPALLRVYAKAKESSLVKLAVDDQPPVTVLIKDAQFDPVRGRLLHVDFLQVRMTEKIETEIALRFEGEAPAVKELGGILVKSLDKVKVSCLPGDLVQEIAVDVGRLKTFEDALHLRDLVLPPGIKLLEDAEAVVATVEPPRSEEELKALEEKVEEPVEAVEVVGKKEPESTEAEAEPAAGKDQKGKAEEKKEKS